MNNYFGQWAYGSSLFLQLFGKVASNYTAKSQVTPSTTKVLCGIMSGRVKIVFGEKKYTKAISENYILHFSFLNYILLLVHTRL